MYAPIDSNFTSKEDDFEINYCKEVIESNKETNEQDRISRIRISMGDKINFNNSEDPELQHFINNGQHEKPQLPPFAVYDMLTNTLNFEDKEIDKFTDKQWCDRVNKVKYVFSAQNKIEETIKNEIQKLQNENVLCKGGMIKSVYHKHNEEENTYETFNHVFAFTYRDGDIHVYDTLDDENWGMTLSDWQENEETNDGYRRVIIGAYAFLHSNKHFPDTTVRDLISKFNAMGV